MATCFSELGDEEADALVGFNALQYADASYALTPGGGICPPGASRKTIDPVATKLVLPQPEHLFPALRLRMHH